MKQRIRYLSLLFFMTFLLSNLLLGQSLKRQSIGSLGSSNFSKGDLYIHLTVGQTYQSNSSDGAIRVGFEQKLEKEKELKKSSTEKVSISAYPNPAISELNIDLVNTINEGQLKIFDINGRLVYEKKISQVQYLRLNITSLNPGLYQANIIPIEGNTSYVTKFIVSK
ncbi:T9SS type A sorting domain-containing protein [Marivirga salinae]|uniref:T9SS type A sorting domain-containing protein n=1 Tax=Marivirga salinarum TaxID=3059078 RepID=A0AA49GFD4_9BACT|nr:T9SS type A sorting domain-containing protein [Marivirga sp. BDSF4-3]WKK77907.1 T9SS type A sorting domain-containing protein [Marivirga sp. BDSF4-3]